jgi:hypothetical protein
VYPNLLVELGLRDDWDRIRRQHTLSPRVGLGWRPKGWEGTKSSAGYAILYDATSIRMFTRHMDQYSLATYFDRTGEPVRGPALTIFQIGNERLRTPQYRNITAHIEQRLPGDVYSRFGYTRRRGRNGFTYLNMVRPVSPSPLVETSPYVPALATELDAVYDLTNYRRDRFDSFEATVRKVFRGSYSLMASYTRSKSFSNAVADLNIDDPVAYTDTFGPLPWDSPNRVLGWGYLPLPRKNWAIAFLLDWRDGFPFTILDDEGKAASSVNSHRLPRHFELNLHAERTFVFRDYRWAFRFGFNNITNQRNPTTANNNIASPYFLSYYGGAGRSTNFRIRWLGRR